MRILAQPSQQSPWKESSKDRVQEFSQNNKVCVFFSMEAKSSALFSDFSNLTRSNSYQCNSEHMTSHDDSWKMSSSLQLTGKFRPRTPTLRVWEGIPQWASEWLAAAEIISESFPTCSTSGRPRPLQPGLLFIN